MNGKRLLTWIILGLFVLSLSASYTPARPAAAQSPQPETPSRQYTVYYPAIYTSAGNLPAAAVQQRKLERFWLTTFNQPPEEKTAITASDACVKSDTGACLLAKARPDECYAGIENEYPPGPPCALGKAKVNEGYVFGLAKSGEQLWIGTVANMPCLVLSQMMGVLGPHQTDAWVCEFGESAFGKTRFPDNPQLQTLLGDWRPPHIHVFDMSDATREDKTPDDPRIEETLGLRSAVAHQGIIFMGGPTLAAWTGIPEASSEPGMNLFAFTTEGEYLGSANLPDYIDVRTWVVVDDVLYTTVGDADGTGSVLRWRGDLEQPFEFEVVGKLDNEGAYIAAHDGRLFVTTWPNQKAILSGGAQAIVVAGLFMSPEIPEGGLDNSHAEAWVKVWQASDYETDPVTALTYMGGALASFDGYLYWGTINFPVLSAAAHMQAYGTPAEPMDILAAIFGTHRPTHIFRGKGFGSPDEVKEVVYGMEVLPVYVPGDPGKWQLMPNKMGKPTAGMAGFGNFFNAYTWTMAAGQGKLLVGTFDSSYVFAEAIETFIEYYTGKPVPPEYQLPLPTYGADLFIFPSSAYPAMPISISGVGNYTNYGVRTMLVDDAIYLGMANPMNLLTDRTDALPEGGWELLRMVWH